DDDDLLVMRTAYGMLAVVLKTQARMLAPPQCMIGHELAIRGVEHREIPIEDVDLQARLACDGRVQQVAQRDRPTVVRVLGEQAGTAIDVPGNDENARCR